MDKERAVRGKEIRRRFRFFKGGAHGELFAQEGGPPDLLPFIWKQFESALGILYF